MNHTDILKRAFHITRRYRALWLFGFFLALCGGGGGGGGGANFPSGGGDFAPGVGGRGDLPGFGLPDIVPTPDPKLIIGLVVLLICFILLLTVIAVAVRAITRTSLMRMVRQVEETEGVTMRQGWRLGWSRRAFRIFLINLILSIPFLIIALILGGAIFGAVLLISTDNAPLVVLGIVGVVALALVLILLLIGLAIVLGPLRELAWREATLNGRATWESLQASYQLIRRRLKDVAILWLIMFGIGLGWAIASVFLTLMILALGLVVGGIPAGVAYLLTESWIAAAAAGIPLFLLVLIVPLTFVTGLYLVYQSAVWTLAYGELQANGATLTSEDESVEPPAEGLPDTI